MTNETVAKLEAVFRERYSNPKYAPGRRDYYNIQVLPCAHEDNAIELHITFRRSERYCCMESGCHFGLWQESGWRKLRTIMNRHGLEQLPPLTIRRLCVAIEDGALFGLRWPGDTRALEPSGAQSYEVGPYHESSARIEALTEQSIDEHRDSLDGLAT